jgi:hypothetical protein
VGLELPYVAPKHFWVEAKLATLGGDHLLAEVTPGGVEQLVERMPGTFLCAFGPEQGMETFASDASLAGTRKHDQERQSAPLTCGRRYGGRITLEDETA